MQRVANLCQQQAAEKIKTKKKSSGMLNTVSCDETPILPNRHDDEMGFLCLFHRLFWLHMFLGLIIMAAIFDF